MNNEVSYPVPGELQTRKSKAEDHELELFKNLIAPPGTPEAQIKLAYIYAKNLGLDPLRKQVMIIKVQGQFQIVVGIHGMGAIISRNPGYMGTQSGCVYAEEEFSMSPMGDVYHEGKPHRALGKPLGAWATTTRRLGDKDVKFTVYLKFSDYNQLSSTSWQKQGPWMIEKTARAFSQREAFPDALMGVYAPEEFGIKSAGMESEAPEEGLASPTRLERPARITPKAEGRTPLPWEKPENTAMTQPADESVFGEKVTVEVAGEEEKEVCPKCGAELIEYQAKSGIWYRQCETAREEFNKTKSMSATKGHFMEKVKKAGDPPF